MEAATLCARAVARFRAGAEINGSEGGKNLSVLLSQQPRGCAERRKTARWHVVLSLNGESKKANRRDTAEKNAKEFSRT